MVQQVSFVKTYCASAVLCQLLSTPLQMPTRTRDFKDTILREERKILAAKRKADAIQRKADRVARLAAKAAAKAARVAHIQGGKLTAVRRRKRAM